MYCKLSDWQILHTLLAARDDDYHLIPIKRRIANLLGKPTAAWNWGKMPKREDLGIPDEAFVLEGRSGFSGQPVRPGAGFIVMYFQRLIEVGFTVDQAMDRYRKYVEAGMN